MSKKTYNWIKKIPAALAELDSIPLLGHPPPFPWEALSQSLTQAFELQDCEIQPSELRWRNEEELFSGLGEPLTPLNFSVTPFEGILYFAMAKDAIKRLAALILLKGNNYPFKEEHLEGFYTFLAIESIHGLNYDPDVIPQLIQDAKLPERAMLTLDIILKIQGQCFTGRAFISPELRESIAKHYSEKGREAPFTSPLSETLEATLHLEAGSTVLSQEEWKKVKPGDFLILDHCALDPGKAEGKVQITFGGHPFLNGEIKEGNVKILEYPKYHQEAR